MSYNVSLKQTAILVQVVRVPEVRGSKISRKSICESGKVVIPAHRPPLNIRYSFLLVGWADPRIRSMKNSTKIIWNRTRDLPPCSAMLQPIAPPLARQMNNKKLRWSKLHDWLRKKFIDPFIRKSFNNAIYAIESYVYWTVHHLDSWIKRDQLDVTCFIISLFNAQRFSDVNTSILRSLRLICWVISWVVLLCKDRGFCISVVI